MEQQIAESVEDSSEAAEPIPVSEVVESVQHDGEATESTCPPQTREVTPLSQSVERVQHPTETREHTTMPHMIVRQTTEDQALVTAQPINQQVFMPYVVNVYTVTQKGLN